MKLKTKSKLRLFGIFISSIFVFQNNGLMPNGITQNKAEVKIAVDDNNRNDNSVDESKLLRKVIEDYVEFSRLQNHVTLKQIVTELRKEKYLSDNQTKSPKKGQETPLATGLSELDYEYIYKKIPEMIYLGKRHLSSISDVQLKEDTANALVILQNSEANKSQVSLRFSLLRDITGQWKIYQIKFSRRESKDANKYKFV
jgi:LAS superfamily LD-carboxypeptidase LdcB